MSYSIGIYANVEGCNKYAELLPSNGWGTMHGALNTLNSIRKCILEQAEDIPIDCMYMRWE